VIRPARAEDAEAVAALVNAINALGPGAAQAMTPAIVRRDLIGAQPKAILRVAEEDGRGAGDARGVGMSIRPLEARDLDALAAMVAALNGSEGYDPAMSPDAEALRRAYLGPGASGRCLVAEAGDLLGYVTLHITYQTTNGSHGAYLGDLFVVASARRRGIGRALLAAAARLVRSRGGTQLWWTALPSNETAQAFYAKLGAAGETLLAFTLSDAAFARLAENAP